MRSTAWRSSWPQCDRNRQMEGKVSHSELEMEMELQSVQGVSASPGIPGIGYWVLGAATGLLSTGGGVNVQTCCTWERLPLKYLYLSYCYGFMANTYSAIKMTYARVWVKVWARYEDSSPYLNPSLPIPVIAIAMEIAISVVNSCTSWRKTWARAAISITRSRRRNRNSTLPDFRSLYIFSYLFFHPPPIAAN